MSGFVYKNTGIWMDGYDIGGDHNEISMVGSIPALDNTTFRDDDEGDAKTKLPGIKDIKISGQGYFNGTGADQVYFTNLAAANKPFSVAPYQRAAGNTVRFIRALMAEYSPGFKIGELCSFSFSAEGHDNIVSGTILSNTTLTTTGNGTAYQLGEVAAGKKLYAVMHVCGVSAGDSIDLIIQSAPAGNFAAPTTRYTFANASAIGGVWATPVDGAITDTWWRASYTINGVDPSITIMVAMGIM